MRSRAGALGAACAAGLLAVVALVLWGAPAVGPGWRTALAVCAVLAVAALSTAVVLAGVVALRGERPPEVSVTVPRDGGPPAATVTAARGPLRWALAALVLAVAGTAPLLVVLLLASLGPAAGESTTDAPPSAAAPSAAPAPGASSQPSAGQSPSTGSPSSGSPTGPPSSGSPTGPPSSGSPSGPPSSDPSDPSDPSAGATSTAPPPAPGSTSPPETSGEEQEGAAPSGGPAPGVPPAGCAVLVSDGDTLWALARSRLAAAGVPVTDDQVAAATARLYAANAGVVGPDPDLILPGQPLDLCG